MADAKHLDTPEGAESQGGEKEVSLPIRIYGFLCYISAIVDIVTFVFVAIALAVIVVQLASTGDLLGTLQDLEHQAATNSMLVLALSGVSLIVLLFNTIGLLFFGRSLLKNRRRKAALWSHLLIATTILDIILNIMLSGADLLSLLRPGIGLVVLIAISVTIDPSLQKERMAQRRIEEKEQELAVEKGMDSRDLTRRGYISLNFFTLFWVFLVSCFLGVIVETIWHMIVVDPGVYQDRAGLLYGPFSPIYGFGAVLMTALLNRLYNKNPVLIFLCSCIIGGLFEVSVSIFMQRAFGVTAWDYSDYTIFGYPDPLAVLTHGRTCVMFACMWGALGFAWIKVLLPLLLKVINLIPWKARYWVTTLCAALMVVDGVMTLQALDCWYERESNIPDNTPIAQFYATYYDNDYMQNRFQSMTMDPTAATRTANVQAAAETVGAAADSSTSGASSA